MIPICFDLGNLLTLLGRILLDHWMGILIAILAYVCLYFSWKLRKI